ncbi:MAG: YHS domain-containing protein [Desulfobacterales bacterium]|nr:YHS domain-containing protein [Desulfobacterales bacterium]
MRLLIFAFLAYLVYRVIKGVLSFGQRPVSRDDRVTIDEMVQDPVCKTYIPLRDALRRTIAGKEYFFCGRECADKFEKEIQA